ncbi:MAG: hypothetical protein ABIS06_12300 [Vicinamibacterales bacterium]
MTAASLATRGMTLISSARQQLDGSPALLLHVSQPAAGSIFLKSMIVIGDAKASVMGRERAECGGQGISADDTIEGGGGSVKNARCRPGS